MGFLRNTIAMAFVATLLFYFVSVGEMEEAQQWITIGVMVTLGLGYILSGSPSFELPVQPKAAASSSASVVSNEPQSEVTSEESVTLESKPVQTMSLKERKAAKIPVSYTHLTLPTKA